MTYSIPYVPRILRLVVLVGVALAALDACNRLPPPPPIEKPAPTMPEPRAVKADERAKLVETVQTRVGVRLPPDAEVRAAGPFRFAGTKNFLYMDRLDTGSVAFENRRYGDPSEALDLRENLPRIEKVLQASGLEMKGKEFAGFRDEYAGAARPARMGPGFDIRKMSKHVARTAAFRRKIEGVPVFGSELVVGLMSDGSLGRLRLHWPPIKPETLAKARELQRAVIAKAWNLPKHLRRDEIEIIDVEAGIKHPGFAVPGFREAAVVRVLVRKSAKDERLPTSSTRYVYLDSAGHELRFAAFPVLVGTPQDRKAAERKSGVKCGDHQSQKSGGLSISPCPEG
jgi:hypothetical protein